MIKTLLLEKSDNTFIQLFRYTFVGGTAFCADIGFLYLLTEYGKIYYLLSAAIAFIIGLTINYFLSVKWVFASRSVQSKKREFIIFTAIGLAGLALNELIMWFFTDILIYYYMVSKIFSTGIVYLWNFFTRKLILFR